MENDITFFLNHIQQWVGFLLPIATLIALIFPSFRNWVKKSVQSLINIREVQEGIKSAKEATEELRKETSMLKDVLSSHIEKDEGKQQALLSMLRDSLMRSFNFYIERGYITLDELNTLQEVYKPYRELGGNGVFKAIWEEKILKLPNQPPEDKED